MAKRTAKTAKVARPVVPDELKGVMRARTKAKTKADAELKAGVLEASTARTWAKSNWETWLERFRKFVDRDYGRVNKAEFERLAHNEFDNKLGQLAQQMRGLSRRKGAFI